MRMVVLPPGFEPRSTAPEAVVLSIELRERKKIKKNLFYRIDKRKAPARMNRV